MTHSDGKTNDKETLSIGDLSKLMTSISGIIGNESIKDSMSSFKESLKDKSYHPNKNNTDAFMINKDNLIAEVIMTQLGGNHFLMMTGATNILRTPYGVEFDLPKDELFILKGICSVKIEVLDDLYLVMFLDNDQGIVSEHSDIHDNLLRGLFTHETGLPTRLED